VCVARTYGSQFSRTFSFPDADVVLLSIANRAFASAQEQFQSEKGH
jgi:hypothetical protein